MKLIVLSDYEIGVSDPNEIIKSNKIFESNEIRKNGVFQPKYYILTSSSGNHYRSVSYKNRKILEFSEIPYQIKLMIVQKSLSSLGGLYDIIDDFIEFKTQLGILSDHQIKKKNQKKEEEEIKRGEIVMDNKLYDPSCTLLFYSKSANMKPGMSSGDIIEANQDKIDWFILSMNPNAIPLLEANQDKISWQFLCRNQNAIHLLEANQDKIHWPALSMNPNAIHLLEANQDKIDWKCLSMNPNAIYFLKDGAIQDKIDWNFLSIHPNAIPLLEANQDKINWFYPIYSFHI